MVMNNLIGFAGSAAIGFAIGVLRRGGKLWNRRPQTHNTASMPFAKPNSRRVAGNVVGNNSHFLNCKGAVETMSCKCQGCGKQYRIDVGVPDEVWERIKPSGKAVGAGLLCGSCIMARLEAMGVYGSYELVESGSYIPQHGQLAICPKCGGKDVTEYIKPPVMFLCEACGWSWGKQQA